MTDQPGLFDGYEPAVPLPVVPLSADRRRTARQAAAVAAGRHPLTRGPIHPLASPHRDASAPKNDPYTCGSCLHRSQGGYHRWPKCWLPAPGVGADAPPSRVYPRATRSATTDVRAWWPACPDYSPGDGAMSPDAARWVPPDDGTP